jgi:hypothetical protein
VVKRCESWKGKIQMANISLANRGIVWEPEPQNRYFMMDNDKSLNFWVTILFFKQTTYSGMFHILIEDPLPFFFTAKIDPSIDSFERPWFVRGGAPKKWCDGSGNGKTIRTTANWLGKLWEIWKHMDHVDHNGINHDIPSFFSNKLSYTS